MPEIEIFRAGKHTAMSGEAIEFSESDLDATAAAYDPAVHEAPVVVGHPAHDAPAYGWVKGLVRDGASLRARLGQLDAQFAELVREGRFKKVSASFYRPDSKANPKPGTYYLRHVGFLGAQPPAVKGLAPVQFADDAHELVTMEFAEAPAGPVAGAFRLVARVLGRLRDRLVEDKGVEAADQVIRGWDIADLNKLASQVLEAEERSSFAEPPKQEEPVTDKSQQQAADEAARQAELDRREEELKKREAAFAERERKRRHDENVAYLEGLVAEGRPLPCEKDELVAFMDWLGEAEGAVCFGEGDEQPPLKVFKDKVLAGLKKQVDFAERAGADGGEPESDPAAIAREAVAYQEEQRAKGNEMSIAEAVRHVTKQE